MEESSMSYRPGTFPFMSFPLEVRRKVYFFAVIRKRPIRLLINYHGLSTTQTLGPGRVRLYTTDFQMLFTCREFRKEMTDVLYAKNAWDISLFMVEFDEGTKFLQIDLRKIKICPLFVHDLHSTIYSPHKDVEARDFPVYWHHHLRAFVATLVFNGHQIDNLLVECGPQDSGWLLECLRPMAMLRNFGVVHFRSCHARVHPYFRFLEAYMMSDQDLPFRGYQDFRGQTEPWHQPLRPEEARRAVPPPRSTDMTSEGVWKSEREMEATAKVLYKILEIEDEMRPQEDL